MLLLSIAYALPLWGAGGGLFRFHTATPPIPPCQVLSHSGVSRIGPGCTNSAGSRTVKNWGKNGKSPSLIMSSSLLPDGKANKVAVFLKVKPICRFCHLADDLHRTRRQGQVKVESGGTHGQQNRCVCYWLHLVCRFHFIYNPKTPISSIVYCSRSRNSHRSTADLKCVFNLNNQCIWEKRTRHTIHSSPLSHRWRTQNRGILKTVQPNQMWKHCIKKSINTEVQLRRFNIEKKEVNDGQANQDTVK